MNRLIYHCILLLLLSVQLVGFQSPALNEPNRLLTVRDGLPQSYISGIHQDRNGLLWIATLNGLGCYDGRAFQNYMHLPSDPASISSNIILFLFDAGDDLLWLCYTDGRIDEMNTITRKVTHLWKNSSFEILRPETRNFKTLIRNNRGAAWMLSLDGGLYQFNLHKKTIQHFSKEDLQLNRVINGIAVKNEKLLMVTEDQLVVHENDNRIAERTSYPFGKLSLFTTATHYLYSPSVRKNGDLVFADASGFRIWNPETHFYKAIPFKRPHEGKITAAFDSEGNYFFENEAFIDLLRPDNTIAHWSSKMPVAKGMPTTLFTDQSGVLWAGTNGFGLRQYNLHRTGIKGYESKSIFTIDLLQLLNIPMHEIKQNIPEQRWAERHTTRGDSVWFSSLYRYRDQPELSLLYNGHLTPKTFRSEHKEPVTTPFSIVFLCPGKDGILWGITNSYHLIVMDEKRSTYHLSHQTSLEPGEEVNGMVIDENKGFYISTNRNLYYHPMATARTEKRTEALPSNDLLHIANDTEDPDILWIGTLSDGLIRFNKTSRATQVYSTATGLPNNTIYSILPMKDGELWCSSNKGVFSFNKRTQIVRSFTSRDGLPDDEFNRFDFMQLPNGEIAFGGPAGFTVFQPSALQTDRHEPRITITGISINNKAYQTGSANETKELKLKYDQNFVTVSFAAMQYDFPDKNQYRYMLKGLDKDWILSGNDNRASYTSLPPGDYTLLMSASNTAGKWSSHIASMQIRIAQPFWNTWWFYVLTGSILAGLVYLFLRMRIGSIRRVQEQKLAFEREAVELHALALRAQMNPHFIFNCLNSIKALIQEKQDHKAVSYLTTFSVLIRRQLSNKSNEINLRDEIETCRLYLALEAMRFEDHITYSITPYDEELGHVKVPPLILQPIVENAIIHGLLPAGNGGMINIRIYKEGDYCVCAIKDNGIGRAAAQLNKSKSTLLHKSEGLHLLEERIAMNNRINGQINSLETIDLFDPAGNAAGTLVVIKFYIDV